MHALASQGQGRLKDVEREYQLTSGSVSAQLARSDAGCPALSYGEDLSHVAAARSTGKEAWSPRTDDVARTSNSLLPPAPLQRLERLESELATLNHARRRLAVDDDAAVGAFPSSAARHGAAAVERSLRERRQGDVDRPVATAGAFSSTFSATSPLDRRTAITDRPVGGATGDDINTPPWTSLLDVGDLYRRQMSGGSVFSTTSSVVTASLQSLPAVSSAYRATSDVSGGCGRNDGIPSGGFDASTDVISSLTRFAADSRFLHDGRTTGEGDGSMDPPIHIARMSTESNEAGVGTTLPRTPGKRQPRLSVSPDSAAERHSSPLGHLNGSGNYHGALFYMSFKCLSTFRLRIDSLDTKALLPETNLGPL